MRGLNIFRGGINILRDTTVHNTLIMLYHLASRALLEVTLNPFLEHASDISIINKTKLEITITK